jgi:hypothetical protein
MVTKQGERQLHAPLADAYRRAVDALDAIGATVTAKDEASGRIEGRLAVTWRSWGEKLSVEVSGVDNDARVRVTSASRLRTTLIDYGKNASNVKRFIEALGR